MNYRPLRPYVWLVSSVLVACLVVLFGSGPRSAQANLTGRAIPTVTDISCIGGHTVGGACVGGAPLVQACPDGSEFINGTCSVLGLPCDANSTCGGNGVCMGGRCTSPLPSSSQVPTLLGLGAECSGTRAPGSTTVCMPGTECLSSQYGGDTTYICSYPNEPRPVHTPVVVASAVPSLVPFVDIKVRKNGTNDSYIDGPITLANQDLAQLQWTSQNVTACIATNGWAGPKSINGTEVQNPAGASRIYTITCDGPNGSVSDFVVVNITPASTPTPTPSATPTPILDLQGRRYGSGDSYSDGPLTMSSNDNPELRWVSQNVTSCTASNAWSGAKGTAGTELQPASANGRVYVLTCFGPYGSVSDFVVVNIVTVATPTPSATPMPTPQLDLKGRKSGTNDAYSDGPITVNVNDPVDLQWTSQNVTACTASNGWNGSRNIAGTETIASVATPTTFTIICSGPNGTVADSFTVFMNTTYPGLSIHKSARNVTAGDTTIHDDYITAHPGDTVEFVVTIQSIGNAPARNVRLQDPLPSGMSYISGTTTKDNTAIGDGLASGVLTLGDLAAGQQSVIKFRALVGNASLFNVGTTSLINVATSNGDGNIQSSDNVVVGVQKTPSATETPVPQSVIIQKLGRDVSKNETTDRAQLTVSPNDELQFAIVVIPPIDYTNVTIRDILPSGITYIPNSTYINGVRAASEGIATSQGLSYGNAGANKRIEIRFDALVGSPLTFPRGTAHLTNLAEALSNDTSVAPIAKLPISVINSRVPAGPIVKAGHVDTGSGSSTVFSLILGVLATTCYFLYTKTALFKTREVESVIEHQHEDKDKFNFTK